VKIDTGKALLSQGQFAQAITVLAQAVREEPKLTEAHGMLGNAYAMAGRWEEAAAAFTQAVELSPQLPAAHFGLGCALANAGRTDAAIAALSAALHLGYAPAHCNLGVALAKRGDYAAAMTELRAAVVVNPADATAHWNLALLLLLQGNWREGWREYEWRWRWHGFPSPRRNFTQPLWNGGDLTRRTILLHAEQGMGDTIQFMRYIPVVAARGGKVIVECYPQLIRLLRQIPGAHTWLTTGQALPEFDVHCPLLSLPLALGIEPNNILRVAPYLEADQTLTNVWRQKIANGSPEFRVGVVWSGSRMHTNQQYRAMSLEMLRPLLGVSGVSFYSLQLGAAAAGGTPSGGSAWIDYTADIGDFADTAALIANLDLVISVDTGVLHLAGALGKPTWGLLPKVPDWRWRLEGTRTNWYPMMKLYRQRVLGDWREVISQVAQDLSTTVTQRNKL